MNNNKLISKILFSNQIRMRKFNSLYLYFYGAFNCLVTLLPPLFRNYIIKKTLSRCGRNVSFDYGIFFKYPWLIEIGDNVSINRGCSFYPGLKKRCTIKIGSNVYIAPNVTFYASGHNLIDLEKHTGDNIIIGNNVWIGGNVIILPGVKIFDNARIAAGSVVTKNVKKDTLVAGVPAQIIKETF